jgi:hypothetical protein
MIQVLIKSITRLKQQNAHTCTVPTVLGSAAVVLHFTFVPTVLGSAAVVLHFTSTYIRTFTYFKCYIVFIFLLF